MEKKYQVFVSSTYKDLQKERQEVMQALLELDCIPVGMELFPAADDDQWTLIKGLISDCDYYVLIVAGRYGSIDKRTGESYTQMEYEFAVEQGIPVISFVHKEPGNIPASNTESTDDGKAKLRKFIELVENKMCQFWSSPEDLGSKVSRSLVKLIKAKPRVGWIKADEISSTESYKEILSLKKENDELKARIESIENNPPVGSDKLEQGEDEFKVHFNEGWSSFSQSLNITWNEIIRILGPCMINGSSEEVMKNVLIEFALQKRSSGIGKINSEDFYTIVIQLVSLGIITKSKRRLNSSKTANACWELTAYGEKIVMQVKALKRVETNRITPLF